MTFTLEEKMVTGIKEIDDQHKELFESINHLITTCNEGKGKEEVGNIIEFMDDYIKNHLKSEENYMNEHSYADFNDHKAEHNQFIEEFNGIKREFEIEGSSSFLALQINQKIVNWLIIHVCRTDKKLACFLKDKI